MTEPKTVEEEPIYVVVCDGLHAAVGPFDGLKEATQVARMLTDRAGEGCVFLPVQLAFNGVIVTEGEEPQVKEKDFGKYHGGQYL